MIKQLLPIIVSPSLHPSAFQLHPLLARSTMLMSVRTAMPVGPFERYGLASSPQAVPAISRCAHEAPSANSFRNAAAVIVPALRPPTFLMSAMSDLICFVYSLSSGNCQNFSPRSEERRVGKECIYHQQLYN